MKKLKKNYVINDVMIQPKSMKICSNLYDEKWQSKRDSTNRIIFHCARKLNLWDTGLLIFISFFLSQYNCSVRYQVKMKTKIPWSFRLYALNIMDSEAVTQRCSVKKVTLEISQISPENTCARALVLKSILVNCRCLAILIFC